MCRPTPRCSGRSPAGFARRLPPLNALVSRQISAAMNASNRCAFCSNLSVLTREHVWPRCIVDRTPQYNAHFRGESGKFFSGDLMVKDVCGKCNNGPLSELDSYICDLYDTQLHAIVQPRQSILFRHTYSLLLRWLLKISYNSARANHSDVDALRGFTPYILFGGDPPPNVAVHLELIRPAKNPRFKEGTSDMRLIPPQSIRCCRVQTPLSVTGGITLRLVAINSFYFWILIRPEEQNDSLGYKALISSVVQGLSPVVLSPAVDQIRLRPRIKNTLNVHKNWVLDSRARSSMREFLAKK